MEIIRKNFVECIFENIDEKSKMRKIVDTVSERNKESSRSKSIESIIEKKKNPEGET